MGLSRRRFLAWITAATGAGALAPAALARPAKTITKTATATFSVTARGGAGRLLTLLRDGTPVQATPITSDRQTVTLEQPVGPGGYVRAGLRDEPAFQVPNVPASRGPMEALTNPIFLAPGPRATSP